MKSIYILRHSALQILRQPKAVLQIFLLPNALAFFLVKVFGLAFVFSPIHMQVAINRGVMPWGLFIGLTLVSIVLWLWSALAWHRFILLAEYPRYPWPGLALSAVRRFVGGSFFLVIVSAVLLFCAMVVLGVVLGIAAGATKQAPGWFAIGVALAASGSILVVGLRLTLVLPHSAVMREGGVGRVWLATRGYFWAFAIVLGCLAAIRLGLGQILFRQGITPFSNLGFTITAALEIAQAIFSVSIVTTFYGYCVEGRPLA